MTKWILAIIASTAVLITGCKPKPVSHVTQTSVSLSGYLATLTTLSDSIAESYNHYIQSTQNNNLEELSSTKELRVMTLQQINNYRTTLTHLTGHQGDSSLLDAIIADTDTLLHVMQNEEISLISLRIRMQDVDTLKSLQPLLDHEATITDRINQQITDSNKQLQIVKQSFLSKHSTPLITQESAN